MLSPTVLSLAVSNALGTEPLPFLPNEPLFFANVAGAFSMPKFLLSFLLLFSFSDWAFAGSGSAFGTSGAIDGLISVLFIIANRMLKPFL